MRHLRHVVLIGALALGNLTGAHAQTFGGRSEAEPGQGSGSVAQAAEPFRITSTATAQELEALQKNARALQSEQKAAQGTAAPDQQKKQLDLLQKQIETQQKMIELLMEQMKKQPPPTTPLDKIQVQTATATMAA